MPQSPPVSSSPTRVSTISPRQSWRRSASSCAARSRRRARPSCRRRRARRSARRRRTRERRDRPARGIADRERVEMTIEDKTASGCASRRSRTIRFSAGWRATIRRLSVAGAGDEETLDRFCQRAGVARRVLTADPDEIDTELDEPVSAAMDLRLECLPRRDVRALINPSQERTERRIALVDLPRACVSDATAQ